MSSRCGLGRLYNQHYRRVCAYAVSRAGRQLAEEIVSEVFLTAWRPVADLPAHELPWLLTVARNVAASEVRAGRGRRGTRVQPRSRPGDLPGRCHPGPG